MEKGYDIVWPLKPEIHWIQKYIKDIWFPMTTDNFPMKDINFVFINNLYNTDIRDSKFISHDQFDLPVVELQIIEGFTLFDWCKVLEKAKKIYTVNTSINYIIDVLNTSCDEYVIYAHDDNNKSQIDYLFLKPHKMLCR